MAFNIGVIDFLRKELLPRLDRKRRVISLARQYITAPPPLLRQYLQEAGLDTDVPGYNWDRFMGSNELLPLLGFEEYDDVDFTADEGCNLIHDMNQPIPDAWANRYDLVFEVGTIEHIFDIRTVFENICRLTAPGGTVFHLAPLTWLNHGFYNSSLTLYYDVYRENGFDNLDFYIVAFPADWTQEQRIHYQSIDFRPDQISLEGPPNTFLMVACMATKQEDIRPFRIPIQAAYDPKLGLSTPIKPRQAS